MRDRFPRNPIVSAVTIVSAEQTSPGVIRQNRWTRMSLGPYGHGSDNVTNLGDECLRQLAGWWTELGGIRDIEAHSELELQTIRWHKLCINAAFNPKGKL